MTFKRVFGLPDFSMSIISGGDVVKLSLRVGMTEHGMGEVSLFGNAPAAIDPARALSGLIEFWPDISGPYASYDNAAVELNLASVLGLSDHDLSFRRDGVFISFRETLPKLDLGSYSVVVIECLLRLGRILSEIVVEPQLKLDWRAREVETDLLPMPEDNLDLTDIKGAGLVDPMAWFEGNASVEVKNDEAREQAQWFAAKCGQSLGEYCLAAIWLYSRDILAVSADDNVKRPTSEDWARESLALPKGLPAQIDVIQLAKEASAFARVELGDLIRDAVNDRNSMARGLFVYRHWFGKQPARKPHADCLVRGRFYAALTDHPDKLGEVVATFIGRRVPCEVSTSDEAVAFKLRSLVHHCVTITGEATFRADREKPVAIRVESVEIDEVGQKFRRLLKNSLGQVNGS